MTDNSITMENDHETRRRLSPEEIEVIKNQVLESIYADIGKSVVKRILWVAGALVFGAYAALKLQWVKIS